VYNILHKWYPTDSIIQEYVNYAYDISEWDLKFVALLDAENWERSIDRQSNARYPKTNIREKSYWFCQIHKPDHPEIVNDSRFLTDRKRQIDQCLILYKWGTKFYWRINIPITIKRFKLVN